MKGTFVRAQVVPFKILLIALFTIAMIAKPSTIQCPIRFACGDGEAMCSSSHTGENKCGWGPSAKLFAESTADDVTYSQQDGSNSPIRKPLKGSVLLVPHGGGPMPLLDDPDHKDLTLWLKTFPTKGLIQKYFNASTGHEKDSGNQNSVPSSVAPPFAAIIVVSAHWEEDVVTITAGEGPEHSKLLYDYSGFPPESYKIQYRAKGDPELARRIQQALANPRSPLSSPIPSRLNFNRGWDHGVFVPLKLMFPRADVPIVQISLVRGLDPDLHIRIGEALRPLLEDSPILLLGSGFTFHNMGAFFGPEHKRIKQNEAFEKWLKETVATTTTPQSEPRLNRMQRRNRLVNWASEAPFGRFCHPREEHLLPLHVCFGAGASDDRENSDAGQLVFDGNVLAKTSGYLWN